MKTRQPREEKFKMKYQAIHEESYRDKGFNDIF